MIEVFESGGRWGWTLIGVCGRPLVWSDERFDSDLAAAEAAKAWRAAFWRVGAEVDHRQARAI